VLPAAAQTEEELDAIDRAIDQELITQQQRESIHDVPLGGGRIVVNRPRNDRCSSDDRRGHENFGAEGTPNIPGAAGTPNIPGAAGTPLVPGAGTVKRSR